ncbi:MAG: hypothetical protein COA88_11030 [Kordia sp.]|nr:MAG: hypothetical protein COA88_11030 [Kordia sp.]
MRPSTCVLPIVPLFHACSWGIAYSAPLAGAKIVFPGPRYDPEALTDLMTAESVNYCAGVPSVFIPLVQYWRDHGNKPPSLAMAVMGGTAPPPSLCAALEEDFGIEFRHAWGMTEMSPLGTVNTLMPEHRALPLEQRRIFQTKQGRPPFGVEVRIVDDDGNRLPHDGIVFGELQVRGPWVIQSYFKDDESRLTEDGWFPTGDVATIDSQCYIHITDRSKDLIKSGGEWISSIDVENTAMGHDVQLPLRSKRQLQLALGRHVFLNSSPIGQVPLPPHPVHRVHDALGVLLGRVGIVVKPVIPWGQMRVGLPQHGHEPLF